MWRIEAPARKNITKPIEAIATNVPRSGSAISRKPTKPMIITNGSSPSGMRLMSSPLEASQAAT